MRLFRVAPHGSRELVKDAGDLSLHRLRGGSTDHHRLDLLVLPYAIRVPPRYEPGELESYRYHEDTAVAMAAAWPAVSVSL